MAESVKKFDFKDIDHEGQETLSVIGVAKNFNRWMYSTIKPYCKGRILEIGSGVGNISEFFIEDGVKILLTDIRDNYCEALRQKFFNKPNLLGVENINIVDKDFDTKYARHIGTFDTVFALNVIEHIEDDNLAIANCKKLLAIGGNLIILVPANKWLYSSLDKELHHYRRYVNGQMSGIFKANGLTVKRSFYFNALGMAGWFTMGRLLKKKIIPSAQMKFYNIIVPFAKLLDAVLLHRVGLSVIVIGEKQG